VALLLFTPTLGRHLLTDTLARRLPRFLDRWVQHVVVHRGLRAVASEAWPALIESELEPILFWGGGLYAQRPQGTEMDGLIRFIVDLSESPSSGLDHTSTTACLDAIHYLHLGLDSISRSPPDKRQYRMVFNWRVLCPANFTALLHRQR
jgi:hypothetical protein